MDMATVDDFQTETPLSNTSYSSVKNEKRLVNMILAEEIAVD